MVALYGIGTDDSEDIAEVASRVDALESRGYVRLNDGVVEAVFPDGSISSDGGIGIRYSKAQAELSEIEVDNSIIWSC